MLAIKGGKILTITDGVIEGGTILIDGGKIVKVGKRIKVPEDAEVIDVTGKVVIRGSSTPTATSESSRRRSAGPGATVTRPPTRRPLT